MGAFRVEMVFLHKYLLFKKIVEVLIFPADLTDLKMLKNVNFKAQWLFSKIIKIALAKKMVLEASEISDNCIFANA